MRRTRANELSDKIGRLGREQSYRDGIPLSQAVTEYLGWLELDRAAARRTVAEYRADLGRFAEFAGGDAGVPDIAGLDRELVRAYQRHLARLETGPEGSSRPLAVSTRARRLVSLRSATALSSCSCCRPAPASPRRCAWTVTTGSPTA